MPPVRLTDEERLSVEWLASRLSAADTEDYTLSDAIRVALGIAIRLEAQKAEAAGEPVPEAVRKLVG